MIRLGDFVGAVLNEMAIARMKAALLAAQLAADFREHEILRDLPIPSYRIGRAEVSLPFAIATVSAGGRVAEPFARAPSDLAAAARHVTGALTEEPALGEAFSLYENQVQRWRQEVAPALAERFAADAAEALSVDGISMIYGYLAKTHYLQSVTRAREVPRARLRESLEAGHPDLVEETGRRLLKQELEHMSGGRSQAGPESRSAKDGEPGPTSAPKDIDFAVSLHVEAKELESVTRVSTLKLELEEGTLGRITFSEEEEAGVE
jgi:hypothetical protein